jgi:hypothetical protein
MRRRLELNFMSVIINHCFLVLDVLLTVETK